MQSGAGGEDTGVGAGGRVDVPISLQGSKSEYLAPLEKMFCSAPTITASISGVVPSAAVTCSHPDTMRSEATMA